MMPEPLMDELDAIRQHIAQLQREYDAMKVYMDREKPGWDAPPHDGVTTEDAPPDYMWQGQPVTFARSLQSDGVPMAWVTLATGESVMAPLIELKPMKESDS